MASATITSKGQITIPLSIRSMLGLKTGDRIDFVKSDDGRVTIKPATRSIMELKGIFAGRVSKPVTLEEMDKAIAAGAVKRYLRSFEDE